MSNTQFEKRALIDPLTGLAVAGAAAAKGHIGGNLLARAAHHGTNLAEVLAHRGFQHALADSVVNPYTLKSVKMMIGPEAAVAYEAAHSAGSQIAALPPNQRQLALKALASYGAADTPILSQLAQAARHELAGTAPTLIAEEGLRGAPGKMYAHTVDRLLSSNVNTPFDTNVQRAVKNVGGIAPGALPFMVDPTGGLAVGGHVGVNVLRDVIGNSPYGMEFAKNKFLKGLGGNQVGAAENLLTDVLASPAVLDAQRAGASIRQQLPEAVQAALTPEGLERISRAGGSGAAALRDITQAYPDLANIINAVGSPETRDAALNALKQHAPDLANALLKEVGGISPSVVEGLRDAGASAAKNVGQVAERAREMGGAAAENVQAAAARAREMGGAAAENVQAAAARAREMGGAAAENVQAAAEQAAAKARDIGSSASERARQAWHSRSAPAPEPPSALVRVPQPVQEPSASAGRRYPYLLPLLGGTALGAGGVLGYDALTDDSEPQLKAASVLELYSKAGRREALTAIGL
jgi:hypothetical protein